MTEPVTMERGMVFHWPRAYDLLLKLVWGRKEAKYRNRVLELAAVAGGQHVLDVGCGTGTLAIAAKKLVGAHGHVSGIDPSAEMIARAKEKAREASLRIDFQEAPAQRLPFADQSFDVVLSTTVIHCLPVDQRGASYEEIMRVLKPSGRLLIVDFGGSPDSKHSLFGHMNVHRRFELGTESGRISAAGLKEISHGAMGFHDLHYMLAIRPGASLPGAG